MNMRINIFSLCIQSRWICFNIIISYDDWTLQRYIYILYNIFDIFSIPVLVSVRHGLDCFTRLRLTHDKRNGFPPKKMYRMWLKKGVPVYIFYVLASTFSSRKRNMWRVMMMHHIFYSSQRETWTTAYFEIGNSHSGSNGILHTV